MSTDLLGTRFESHHEVTLEAIVRYAGASGDFTPIHWDADEARAAGYDRFFAMGMLPAGWLSALLVRSFGPGSVRSFRVRFRSRSWVGLKVRCTGDVLEARSDGSVVLALAAVGPDGEVLVDGRATVMVAGDSAGQSPK